MKLSAIQVGEMGILRGRVVLSNIANIIDGEKLEQENQKAVSSGRYPSKKPYSFITIEHPEIICDCPKLKAYLEQKCYSGKGGNLLRFTAKSPFAPSVGHLDKASGHVQEIVLERELASGVEVQLLVGVYHSKRNKVNGLGLNNVTILDPEIRYLASGTIRSMLETVGMVWVPMRKR